MELWKKFNINLQVPSDIRELQTLDPMYLENRIQYVNKKIEEEQKEFLICREGAKFYAQQAELREKRRNVLTSMRDAIMHVRNLPKETQITNAGKRKASPTKSVVPLKRIVHNNRLFTEYVSPLNIEEAEKRAKEILEKENEQLEMPDVKKEIIGISSDSEAEKETMEINKVVSRMLAFEKHIIIRFQTRPEYTEIVHISARTAYSHIGQTISHQLSRYSRLEQFDEPLMVKDRLNGRIEIKYPCYALCHMRLRFHNVFFDETAYVVPNKTITSAFAPVRIELGRTFVERYVRDIDRERKTILFKSEGAEMLGCFSWKHGQEIFNAKERQRRKIEEELEDN